MDTGAQWLPESVFNLVHSILDALLALTLGNLGLVPFVEHEQLPET
jgi:hypothetical protein